VQISQFALQQHVIVIGACDIARPARAGAAPIERLMHRRKHRRMLAHAEVIIGAPHRYFAGAARMMVPGTREGARLALQICKYAIPALTTKAVQLTAEMSLVVHDVLLLSVATGARREKRGSSPPAQAVMVALHRRRRY
jgi:hypothetical protein